MFIFQKIKIPKLIHRFGNNNKDIKVENEVPTKRKRAESIVSNATSDIDTNNSSIVYAESSSTTVNKSIPQRRKLRRTKKSENLRDEWKKYHNNFIPVIPTDTSKIINNSNTINNSKIMSSNPIDVSNTSQEYKKGLKYSIKNVFDKSNYVKLNESNSSFSEEKDGHISKKRRLFSFIQM